ncbi:neuronal acetylcholine receptor subunit alpha-10-like [Schistocerca nitens]|uniref:neuronal acetylcholine receptor subunit alpha-10-like n=1 Tax=Schistocerca nitens TaxID=7011 RepID=UPI0021199C1F|nr:neuronal acetylcholine receptor subunit alpha-10-like [Schistocerca nitens]
MASADALMLLLLLPLLLLASARANIQPGGQQPSCPAAPGPGGRNAAQRLHHDLFCGYETAVLPIADINKNIEVSINVWLHSIDINEYYHESLQVNTWILMDWNDDYLPWDPNVYDGIQDVRPRPEEIWTPSFIVTDQWQGASLQAQRPTEECIATHAGEVECMWPASFSLACQLEYALWPFDSQLCEFSLISISDNSSRMTLHVNNQTLTMWMLENPEWAVEWSRVEPARIPCPLCGPGQTTPVIHFRVALRRRAALYLAAVTVPAFGLALLTLLPYFLPPSTPQRPLLAAAGVLAHLFILQVIASAIYGPAGISVPPIVLLVRDSLGLCTLTLVTSVAHRWLVATCPEPPAILRASSTRLLDLWAASLSFVRLQVSESPSPPGTPAADFWLRWTGAVDVCVLAVSVVAYVIVLARFLP